MYQLLNNGVMRLSDGACIPRDPDNTDYQAYQKWTDEGGVAESAALPPFNSAAALQRLREKRRPILDALTGIAGRLSRKGLTSEATAADTAAQSLLDLPKHPALATATTDAEYDTTALYLYRQIAVQCPPSVQTAFLEAV